MAVPFTHLHVHSEYSLLDGVSRIPKLVKRAKELGMDALALTDHGAMYGAIEFYTAAQKEGIKPIIGCEVYVAPGSRLDRRGRADATSYHLLLLARDHEGYKNLLKLVTKAHTEGYYYKPRVDRELLAQHAAGLICTSACPSGELARRVREGDLDGARAVAAWHREVFGADNYYIELQEHGIPAMAGLNDGLIRVARDLKIPLVATNDAHYVLPEDSFAQELLICIQTNTTLDDPNRLNINEHGNTFYLRSPEEMTELFKHVPEALENTLAIAERCRLDLQFGRVQLPEFPLPEGYDEDSWLAHLCWEGARRRYGDISDAVRQRLEHELDVVKQTGFARYILIVADFVRHARSERIFFGPRGSAAGSMICYCLGIADVEPLSNKLLFERFLNIERKEMPDIDMDFADDRRGEMIDYAVRKYGRDRVAQIITFGTLGARAAIRDVGRAMGLDYAIGDRVAKLIPTLPVGIKIDEAIEQVGELKAVYEQDETIRKLIDAARQLEGIARHASTHAAGVVISADPLDEVAPLQKTSRGNKGEDEGESAGLMTQYEMGAVAKIGLLKMDFLGLANLTIIGRCLELVRRRHPERITALLGEELDIARLPLDDAAVYAHLAEGETTGIFQFESAMMRKYLRELRPTCIGDLAAMVALYRPGPMEHIPRFIRSKHGLERIEYLHPVLEPILADTYGIIVYQEQVLQIAQAVAGYSLAQADILRKAMGKKIKEEMVKQKAFFLDGAEKKGFSRELASEIWELVEPFAGYGFNRAHACCYALVAYQTAYLKVHFPAEYMCAVLSTQMDDTEKVQVTVAECRRLGIEVRGPDINRSDVGFAIDDSAVDAPAAEIADGIAADPAGRRLPAIRFGLGAIKNVGTAAAAEIVARRAEGGPFTSVDDLCRRINCQTLNKRVLESLTKAGALDDLAPRGRLLAGLDQVVAAAQSAFRAQQAGQISLFDMFSDTGGAAESPSLGVTLPNAPEVPRKQALLWEKELMGVYISNHPLVHVDAAMHEQVTAYTDQITSEMAGQKVTMVGMVAGVRTLFTKKSETMAAIQFEDLRGSVEVVVFPKTYERTRDLWVEDAILRLEGKVDYRNERLQVICESAEPCEPTDAAEPPAPTVAAEGGPLPAGRSALAALGPTLTLATNGHAAPAAAPGGVASPGTRPASSAGAREPATAAPANGPRGQTAAVGAPGAAAAKRVGEPAEAPEQPNGSAGSALARPGTPPEDVMLRRVGRRTRLRITFERGQDTEADMRRLQDALNLLDQFKGGTDEVELVIVAGAEPRQRVEMELPNLRPRFTPALRKGLEEILGPDALAIDEVA